MGNRWRWVAWSMLAVFIVSVVFATILGVADGSLQQDPAGGAGLQAVHLADPGRRPAGLDRPAVLVGLDRGQIALTEAAGQRRGAQRLVDRRRVRTGSVGAGR